MNFEFTEVFNWRAAFRGMRNPLKSWDKGDSGWDYDKEGNKIFSIQPKDLELARKLIKGGSEHRKFLRQIIISADITAPRYWWSEFDTYKIGTSANSESTMHKLGTYWLTRQDFEKELVWDECLEYLNKMIAAYRNEPDQEKKNIMFESLKGFLPEAFLQKRTICVNYEVAYHIYCQRKHHRLDCWKSFCTWCVRLPNWEILFGGI